MSEVLDYFFDAYFHQDWRDDYGSSFEAAEDFAKTEPAEAKTHLTSALSGLLEREKLPQDTLNGLGGNFKPESENMEVREWVIKVIEILSTS
ncbi:contact-dependent growth inhibition system immunity protein [Halioxenophilus aromaticivorans]|uniref:CdiI immunity protein domain-containing protein n=1 Tax=Halioxenophilus aromaticivorans TaxID=1306992 RepID=A0AAV3TWN8_9ALTE